MNFAGSRKALNISPIQLQGGGASSGADAAGMSTYGGMYAANQKTAPKFDEIGATSMATRSAERAAVTKAEADTHSAGLNAMATVKSAKIQAEAAKAAARSQAQGSMFGSALGAVGSIGGALIGLSDETTKENIKSIDDGLGIIRQLKPKSFNYKPDYLFHSDRPHNGFIAQDYVKVLPEATYNDEESGKMCIDLAEVIAPLVRAVQQLETRVARMEAEKQLTGAK